MLSSPAVVLHPYGLPVYPQTPTCYSGLVQGAPAQDGGSATADPALTPAYGPPPAYPPTQPPPPATGRIPLEFSAAHPAVTGAEFQDHALRVYQPPQPPLAEQSVENTVPAGTVSQETSSQADLTQSLHQDEDDSSKPQPKRLHVSNIPFRFRDPDLRQMFGCYIITSNLLSTILVHQGFGFVTFESSLEADRAREKLNGTIVEGRKIEVNNATARVVTKKAQTPLINGDIAHYSPSSFPVASFPYPVAAPALAYRGATLRGRGRAVYNTIRSATATATPTPVPAYPGYGGPNMGGYPAYRVAQPASATTTYSDGYGRVYTAAADPYHHTVGPTATYGVGTVVSYPFVFLTF
uniref:RNA binding protein fox-1 homolog n=1 Tax=Erpetoichthys calabaricus TaxID=27687 RepID=A0A8C4XI37_ERPCA